MRADAVLRILKLSVVILPGLLTAGCEYGAMLRPSVLSELNPPVVRLVDVLPDVDAPNKAVVAQLFAVGGLSHARVDPDGVMRAEMTVPAHRFMWRPALIDVPHGGLLELRVSNYDDAFHIAYLPSDGGRQVLDLPAGSGGIARLRLDQPGLYWFGCPVADHAGRGMLGFIIVRGNAPRDAVLDRPPQPQPAS